MQNLRNEEEIMAEWKGSHDKPLVSICCVTYNHSLYIEDAIKGFLIQETNFPFEILIHDDASTDGTSDIIREYEARYPCLIKPIYQTENQYSQIPIISPRFLFPIAKGEFVALCEGDDYWNEKKKLQLQVNSMEAFPEIGISFHPSYECRNNKEVRVLGLHSKKTKIFSTKDAIRGGSHFMPTQSIVLRRDMVQNLPDFLYDAPFGDYYIQALGSRKAGALYINRVMSSYRTDNVGSFNNRPVSLSQVVKRTQLTKNCMRKLDIFLDRQYSKDIDYIVSIQQFRLASLYLQNNKIKEFKKTVIYAHHKCKGYPYSFLYYFREFPGLLKFLILLVKK